MSIAVQLPGWVVAVVSGSCQRNSTHLGQLQHYYQYQYHHYDREFSSGPYTLLYITNTVT